MKWIVATVIFFAFVSCVWAQEAPKKPEKKEPPGKISDAEKERKDIDAKIQGLQNQITFARGVERGFNIAIESEVNDIGAQVQQLIQRRMQIEQADAAAKKQEEDKKEQKNP